MSVGNKLLTDQFLCQSLLLTAPYRRWKPKKLKDRQDQSRLQYTKPPKILGLYSLGFPVSVDCETALVCGSRCSPTFGSAGLIRMSLDGSLFKRIWNWHAFLVEPFDTRPPPLILVNLEEFPVRRSVAPTRRGPTQTRPHLDALQIKHNAGLGVADYFQKVGLPVHWVTCKLQNFFSSMGSGEGIQMPVESY